MKLITKIEALAPRLTKEKTRVAAYCRISTGKTDQIPSLEAQRAHYEALICANPEWEFAGIYYDSSLTGTSRGKRPALMQMIADCEAGKIDRILTKSLSRFARNTTDCLEMVRELLDLGVTIYFEKENLDTGSMESELLLSIMSSLAESESVSISENNKWGVRHRFETGTYNLGYSPYGYDVKGGVFSINENEAKWVRWIFEQALGGKTSAMIANELNERKVPSKRKGTWTASTIRGILTNEKYTGDCLFQKTYTDFRFRRHKNHGERDQFYMEGHHEPIISHEDFEAAGAMLIQRAKEKNIKKNDQCYRNRYPFSGKIFCGECGSGLKRRINSTGCTKYPVWACKQHLLSIKECAMKSVREVDLEYAFTTMMNKLIFARKEVLDTVLKEIQGVTNKEKLHRINEIEINLEKNTEKRQTLTTLMTKGFLEQALFMQESNELNATADALSAEKERLIKEVTGDIHRVDALKDLIEYVGHAKPNAEFNGELVCRFLDRATLLNRSEIVFHLKCGLNLKERIGKE